MLKLLLVEDDKISSDVMKNLLEKKIKCNVDQAENGEEAIKFLNDKEYNLIISDIVMPNMDGWEFLAYLQDQNIATPIVMLTALNGESDQLRGYDYEIEEYVVKPINPDIFIKKIKSIINRIYKTDQRVQVHPQRYSVMIEDREIVLPKKEFKVFNYLYERAGSICPKVEIHNEFWGDDETVSDRVVDYTIRRIRNHFGDERDVIKTKVGVGYYYDVK